jgi:hypothetical protein
LTDLRHRRRCDDVGMTTASFPAGLLERAGLPATDLTDFADAVPPRDGAFNMAMEALAGYLARGRDLIGRLPAQGSADERAAREAIAGLMNGARDDFLRGHATALYDAVTGRRARSLRVEALCEAAAALVPGLVPSPADMVAERARRLPDKEGIEFAVGLLAGHVLALPEPGRHLVEAMLAPVPEAFTYLEELRTAGAVDLGPVRVTRRGRAAILELSNPRHLNAEDDVTLGPTECAVDLILLDPDIEVGVIRGGVVEHPGYPGTRVFGSGINLTRLYLGLIDYMFYLVRDLGYVNKIYRGISLAGGRTIEKLWVAAVERLPAAARRGPRDRHKRFAAVPARAQGGDHSRRLQPAPAPFRRGPRRAPGDPVRPGVDGGRAGRGPAVRRGGAAGRDGPGAGRADRRADELWSGERGSQPQRAAGRPGARRPVP